ncbi:cation channel sperm-associated auxiliary subunit epsilon isoform X2 [Heliangelus exortis]|uniref:cation channel sperm-associated auxiliary subunit epsilon isoform X2 n=1 Tax=Heliangelus exortis TaxID=472823 RepID=UPI003A94C5CE
MRPRGGARRRRLGGGHGGAAVVRPCRCAGCFGSCCVCMAAAPCGGIETVKKTMNTSLPETLKFLWNPETDKHQNYRSCFVFHQNSASEGLPKTHQILNSSLNNYTVWATSQSAIYVFRVRKLDQNYRSDTPRIILYSIIMLFIFLEVIVSYKYTTTKIETLSFQEN